LEEWELAVFSLHEAGDFVSLPEGDQKLDQCEEHQNGLGVGIDHVQKLHQIDEQIPVNLAD
jgi:hypothetical protein